MLAEDREGLDHLLVRLAEADHQAGLRRHLVAAHLLGVAQHAAGALEARAAAGHRVQPRHDLDVVVEDVGPLGDDLRQRHLLAAEVGRQHLDLAARRLAADLADDADERTRAVVGQVVAVDGGDDRVTQAHLRDRARDAGRLERVVPRRLAGAHVAEAAAPRARVAEDHERRGAALPALADVRARGLLADRVQVLVGDELRQLAIALAARRLDLEPRRLALAHRPHVGAEDAEHVHPAWIGAGAGREPAFVGGHGRRIEGSGQVGRQQDDLHSARAGRYRRRREERRFARCEDLAAQSPQARRKGQGGRSSARDASRADEDRPPARTDVRRGHARTAGAARRPCLIARAFSTPAPLRSSSWPFTKLNRMRFAPSSSSGRRSRRA